MRVLVACEFSGTVREAFRSLGHDAWSCDVLPTLVPSKRHIRGDVRNVLHDSWDLVIAHPPCTYLTSAAAHLRNNGQRLIQMEYAIQFVRDLWDSNEKVVIENPTGVLSCRFRPPDQIVHPWMFGDPYMKRTCLWLKGVRKLDPTSTLTARDSRKWILDVNADCMRRLNRSITFNGMAWAMAMQWGGVNL